MNRPEVGLGYVELHFYRINDDGSVIDRPRRRSGRTDGRFHGARARRRWSSTGQVQDHGAPVGPRTRITTSWEGRFNLKNSRIVRDVSPDKEIVIDVSRLEG